MKEEENNEEIDDFVEKMMGADGVDDSKIPQEQVDDAQETLKQ